MSDESATQMSDESATQTAVESEQMAEESYEEQPEFDIDEMIEQLEGIWQDGDLNGIITEQQWQGFLDSIKDN